MPPSIALGDLRVRRLGFGTMRICGRDVWGEPRDPAQARAVLRRAVELGVELFDTADAYGPEVSERLIAEALHPYPDRLVIATKGGYVRHGPGSRGLRADGRPEHLRAACEASLRRLRLERIDLYQLHTVDAAVPLEESVGALAELQSEGKIRHIGLSNVGPAQLERARAVVPIVSVQNRFNLAERGAEPTLEACERAGIAFIAWFPLAKRMLTGRHGALAAVGRARSATPAQVALAWLLHRSPALVPIPGTASVGHLDENVAAAAIELGPADLALLESYRPPRRATVGRSARGAAGLALSRARALGVRS